MHNRRKRGNQGKKIAKATLHINMPDGEARLTLDGATFDLAGLKFTGLNLMDKKNDDNTEDEALARCAMILEAVNAVIKTFVQSVDFQGVDG